ncbi:MAG: L,D-transpeptidase [Coriobacteriales bacterium]|nr:L,D-transpeptidase [Coriobacteriales bacterium]
MNAVRALKSVRIVLVVALALSFAVAPASAVDAQAYGTPVPNNATIGGVSLKGMSETSATAEIVKAAKVPTMSKLSVRFGSRKRTFLPQTYVSMDVPAMLAQAYASRESTVTTYTIAPRYKVNTSRIALWMKYTAKKIDHKPISAYRYVKGRKMYLRKSVRGLKVDQKAGAKSIALAVRRSANASGAAQPRVAVYVKKLNPTIPTAKVPKAIMVVLGRRTLTLYRKGSVRVEKKYRCAVGMPKYPTPKGTWKIVAKNPHPSWTNPGSGWASNMPSYIPPGPSNPLGLRALYLNAPGIRIHGTRNTGSIGTAASHGCIRLTNSNVVDIYPRVPVGTKVYIVK